MSVTYPADAIVPADIMVDMETLGSRPGCAILSIGAVAFDLKARTLGAEFHTLVSTASCRELGLREERGTREWWNRQSSDARAVLDQAASSEISLEEALDRLDAFCRAHGGAPRVRIWGNGADFDNAILADIYARLGRTPPWRFWNSRCFRTYKSLVPGLEPKREGVHHDALDDARHQAAWALRIAEAVTVAAPQSSEAA